MIARIAKKKGLVLRREDELHAAIGRQIRDLRKARGLTLKQMARRTNLVGVAAVADRARRVERVGVERCSRWRPRSTCG